MRTLTDDEWVFLYSLLSDGVEPQHLPHILLFKEGLVAYIDMGYWALTDKGRDVL